MDCLLCHPLPGYEVWESMHWRLAVNRNQNTLGKCFLILRRHDEDICDLTPAEDREGSDGVRKPESRGLEKAELGREALRVARAKRCASCRPVVAGLARIDDAVAAPRSIGGDRSGVGW